MVADWLSNIFSVVLLKVGIMYASPQNTELLLLEYNSFKACSAYSIIL